MKRFQLLSDLHLEKSKLLTLNYSKFPIKAPYLILAGDIGYPEEKKWKDFINFTSYNFEKVFYVPGNHEYYQSYKLNNISKFIYTKNELDLKMRELCLSWSNIHFLEKDSYTLDSKIKIIGTTLWANVENYLKLNFEKKIVPLSYDFQQIFREKYYLQEENKWENKLINLETYQKYFLDSYVFLKKEILEPKDNLPQLIITHHLPSHNWNLEKFKKNPYIHYFSSDLEHLFSNKVKVWCCGHSHNKMNMKINNVNLYRNTFDIKENDLEKNIGFTFDFF